MVLLQPNPKVYTFVRGDAEKFVAPEAENFRAKGDILSNKHKKT